MKTPIRINFSGFWRDLDPEDNFFTNTIRQNYPVEISDDPDYLFCSVFSNKCIYNEKAIRIFYTGECQTPDFNIYDYAMGFDYLSFGDRYCRVPHYLLYGREILEKALDRGGMRRSPAYKDRFCSFIYSNSKADSIRGHFFNCLNYRRHVDSGGRYLNNLGQIVTDKIGFESRYRFSIAFENCSYPGYITEKIIQAFAAGTIPIYWGDPEAERTLNPNAYIHVKNMDSIDEVIDQILRLDNDVPEYKRMLSESPFVNDDIFDKQIDKLIAFISNIIETPKEEAFRRNRGMRGRNYENFFKKYTRLDEGIRKAKNIVLRGM